MPPASTLAAVEVTALIEEHETLIRQLYEAFAKAIPEQMDFWLSISAVEARHVKYARTLKEHAKQEQLRLRADSKVDGRGLRAATAHIRLYLREVEANGISAKRAAVIAKELEDGYLEREIEGAFETDNEAARRLLDQLHADTEDHSTQMDALLSKRGEFESLVARGRLSPEQIEVARTLAVQEGLSMESVLISRFGVPKTKLLESLGTCFHLRPYEFREPLVLPPDAKAAFASQYDMLKARLVAPVGVEDGKLVLALANPRNMRLRDELRYLVGQRPIEFRVAVAEDVLAAIDAVFREDVSATRRSARLIFEELNALPAAGEGGGHDDPADRVEEDDSAVVKLVNTVIEEAHGQRASDIHIEPDAKGSTVIRYRVDGVMRKAVECPRQYRRALISRIKIMAGLDIAEHRKPQSGKVRYNRWGTLDLELRVEVYPTVGDEEDAVLRLLAAGKPRPLTDLTLSAPNVEAVKSILRHPYGLFLCVGPTGSGKTTTLHAALGHINDDSIKILTVEDPVEITQAGLRQVQVNRKAGLTFAEALRSFLRSDPDVIMIGEMRDLETAMIAIEASLTGHLVFSTLHTNTAPETVTRLLDMGLDPYSFSDALLGVLAQRLVRTLCPFCGEAAADTAGLAASLRQEYGADESFEEMLKRTTAQLKVARNGGCKECGGTGYRGRAGIHEFLLVDDDIRRLMVTRANAMQIRERGAAAGMRSLRQDGIEKILQGFTTLAEVNSVCSR